MRAIGLGETVTVGKDGYVSYFKTFRRHTNFTVVVNVTNGGAIDLLIMGEEYALGIYD